MGSKPVVTTKLVDLCELIVDCPHSTPEWTDSGFIVLRNQNIRNGSLDLSSPSFTDENGYNSRIKRAVPQVGDIVLTREAPMGEVCLIPEGLQCCLGQRQVLLRPKKGISGEYLFWALQSPFVQHQISWNEGTGTTVSNIRIPVLKAFEIPRWFENEPQIASHLSAIKNKLTLNRQINQTLEQLAQALFKSWFVDFDPVVDNALDAGFFEQDIAFPDELLRRAEARKAVREQGGFKPLPEDIRQLFPTAFEESSEPSLGLGGWVPKGWTYKTAENIADVSIGKTPPRKESEWFSEQKTNNTTWVSIRDMGMFGSYTGNTSEYLTSDAIKKFNIKKVPKGAILLSFKLTLGRVSVASEELTTNEAIAHFVQPKFSINTPYLYCYLSNFNYSSLGSTSSIATAVNSKIIKNMPILVPTKTVLDCYKKQSESSFQKMKSLDDETAMLTNLRDTLLPKLISGELRLDEIEADIAEEGAV